MKAVVYEGPRNIKVKDVADAKIEKPTDVLVQNHSYQHMRLRPAHV